MYLKNGLVHCNKVLQCMPTNGVILFVLFMNNNTPLSKWHSHQGFRGRVFESLLVGSWHQRGDFVGCWDWIVPDRRAMRTKKVTMYIGSAKNVENPWDGCQIFYLCRRAQVRNAHEMRARLRRSAGRLAEGDVVAHSGRENVKVCSKRSSSGRDQLNQPMRSQDKTTKETWR